MTTIRKKILIVEDDGIIALDLREKLEQAGYHVPIIATNSREAIDAVASDLPDLILMDIRLSGSDDGIETAEGIRKVYQLPIIFVTAHADSEMLDRAKLTGPFGYIVKPFGGVNFHAQIEMALWKHSMEQRLKASEAWLSTTFRNVADALITTDAQGNIVLMSDSAENLTGWSIEEAKGKSLVEVFDVYHEATGLPVIDALEAVYDDQQANLSTSAFVLYNKEQVCLLIEGKMSASRDAGGLLLGIICVFRNISERRKVEEQQHLVQKMNALSLMALGMAGGLAESHRRIGRPLPQLIREAGGQTRRMLEDMQQGWSQQEHLVEQLEALGKTSAGPTNVVDLNAVIIALENQFRTALGDSRPLKLELQNDLPPIKVDVEELRLTLLRLVVDAGASLPHGSGMDITTKAIICSDGTCRVRLEIRDRGYGIRSSSRLNVFDPYHPARPGGSNSGIMLTLVHQFVALNAGSIEVGVPEDVEGGTRFLITLPAAPG